MQLHWQAANEPDVSGPHSPVTPDTEVMEEEIPTMNTFSAVIAYVLRFLWNLSDPSVALLASLSLPPSAPTIVSCCTASYLPIPDKHFLVVASIEEFAERYHIGKPFIGLILLPIVANAAEHVSAVMMAYKNRMEATIAICVGSSIVLHSFFLASRV